MNVLISNLPGDVTAENVEEILKEHGVPVRDVTLSKEGNPDDCDAVVDLDTDHAGANALAKMVDGKYWRGRTLRARPLVAFSGEGLNKK